MADLCIVGEAFGEFEERNNFPFVGKAGAELYRIMVEAGFPFEPISFRHPGALKMKVLWKSTGVHLTNVFMIRPENNKIDLFLAKKKNDDGTVNDVCTDLPPVKPGLYLRSEYRKHVDALHEELLSLKPNLIVATGNIPCWAILQTTKISSLRGTVVLTDFGKVLPVYHPAAILRNYEYRPVTVMDFHKARREMKSPEFSRKRREIWVEPEIEDLWRWWEEYGSKSDLLSIDIETERCKQISEIGIASDSTHALHIPFIVDRAKSYWKSADEEVAAWKFVRHVMESDIPKVGQNFLYDFQYLWKVTGIPVRNFQHDTMLLHHALYPGMQKSLGFLGSVYTDEPAWKMLRREGNKDDE